MTHALQARIKCFLSLTSGVTVQMRVIVLKTSIIVLLILVRIMALVLMMVYAFALKDTLARIAVPNYTVALIHVKTMEFVLIQQLVTSAPVLRASLVTHAVMS